MMLSSIDALINNVEMYTAAIATLFCCNALYLN
jgi:hypothetical protein